MADAQPPQGEPTAKDEHWRTALKMRMKKDQDRCEIWKDEVQNILVFSGLFSTIVTAFIIESHKSLRVDTAEQTVQILSQIAAQLAGNMTVAQANRNGGFLADNSSIRVNTFWFLSLVVSLTTALIGIISLQWIRIHLRVPSHDARLSLSLFHMYSLAMDAFYVPHIFASLPVLLILGLALFLIGLIDFLLDLNTTVAIPVVSAIGLTLAFLLITTTLPGFQSLPIVKPRPRETPLLPCPYRSPQSLLFLRFVAVVKAPFRAVSEWLAKWVDDYNRHDHKNWLKDKMYSFLSLRFPEYLRWRYSWEWKEDWASHGRFWLLQRDMDRMQMLQPSSNMLFSVIIEGPWRPAVFDAVQALVVLDSDNEELGISRCINEVLAFIEGDTQELQYVISCFPQCPFVTPADFLVKHCADDGILRDFAFIAFRWYSGSPALIDVCLRITSWLVDKPRIFPTEEASFTEHPLQLIASYDSCPPSVYSSLLTTLDCFFNFSAGYYPKAEDIDKTTHTSRYTCRFLKLTAIFFTKRPLTATTQTQHDNILSNITARLEEDGGHDYLFLTASIYASGCLDLRQMPWPLGGAFISMLAVLKQYRVGFETRRQADEDIDRLSKALHAHWTKWDKIDAALDNSRSPLAVTQGPSLEEAHSLTPNSSTKSCTFSAVTSSEGPSGSVIPSEQGSPMAQEGTGSLPVEVIEEDPPLGATGGHPLHDHTQLDIADPTQATDKPESSSPSTSSLEILVVARKGGEAPSHNDKSTGAGRAPLDAPQAPDNPVEPSASLGSSTQSSLSYA